MRASLPAAPDGGVAVASGGGTGWSLSEHDHGFPGAVRPDHFPDHHGRDIQLRYYSGGPLGKDYLALLEMYRGFDSRFRSAGIPPVTEPKIRRWLDVVLAARALLAWHGDRAVGHAVLLPYGERGHELAVFVHQDYHHSGVGDHLVGALLADAAERGVERVCVLTDGDNRAMLALAFRHEFVVVERGGGQVELALGL